MSTRVPGLVCAYGEGALGLAGAAGDGTGALLSAPRCAVVAVGRPGVKEAVAGRTRVFLWGYLVGADAQAAAEALERQGPAAVESLDGSFVLAAWNGEELFLFTDRTGSRPWFAHVGKDLVVVAPEVKRLLRCEGVDRAIVPGSLAAMAMNGALLGEATYSRGIRLLGPARRVRAGASGIRVEQYWRRSFVPSPSPSPPPFAEVVREHLAPYRRPVLALSGGFDSRLLLAAAPMPSVVWGFDHVREEGSDFEVGAQVAEASHMPLVRRVVDVDRLRDHAAEVVRRTDGLLGHLGNFPEGDAPARELAAAHDAVVFGHEMFGWGRTARSPKGALERVGVQTGRRLSLLRFLLRPSARREVLLDYERQWRGLLADAGEHACADDLKDHLYWRTRFPRLIGPAATMFFPHIDVVAPWLDRRVLDWVGALAPAARVRKEGPVAAGRSAFPRAFEVPLNTRNSRVDWRSRLRELGPAGRFAVETLLEPEAAFEEWFDRRAIEAWLVRSTGHRARVPLPLRWRASLLAGEFKARLVVNLLVLKLWFGLLRGGAGGE